MTTHEYSTCLKEARTILRAGPATAMAPEDLLHDALLVAATEGRTNLSEPQERAWLAGVMRNLVRMSRRATVRSSARGRRWEADRAERFEEPATSDADGLDTAAVAVLDGLSPASRQVAVLLMHDLDRDEMAWILDITPAALRQRIRVLRRQLATLPGGGTRHAALVRAYASRRMEDMPPDARRLRAYLIALVQRHPGIGMADPDGHLVVFRRSSSHVSGGGGN